MRNPITLSRLTARLAVMVSFTALLSAASFQAALAQTAPSLGRAAPFAVLGASTVTNTGPTIVTGDLGVSPGSAVTGFPPGIVNGTIFTTVNSAAGPAQADARAAYDDLVDAGGVPTITQACNFGPFAPTDVLGGPTLATLVPGVYCFSSSAQLTGTLTLVGGPTDVWIFRIGSTLTTASNSSVVMSGSGQDTNVFWAVGSSATIGTDTAFTGNILAVESITLNTRASVSGRAIALTGAVTMDTNNVASRCSSSPVDCPHPLPIPPRPPGDVNQLAVDHYKCYEAKPEGRVQLPNVVLDDQFGTSRPVTVRRPQLYCTPVVKNLDGSDLEFPDALNNPFDQLVCYDIGEGNREGSEEKKGKKSAERRNVLVDVDNQFGDQSLKVRKPKLLCVPSLQTRSLLSPHDRDDDDEDDEDDDDDKGDKGKKGQKGQKDDKGQKKGR